MRNEIIIKIKLVICVPLFELQKPIVNKIIKIVLKKVYATFRYVLIEL